MSLSLSDSRQRVVGKVIGLTAIEVTNFFQLLVMKLFLIISIKVSMSRED